MLSTFMKAQISILFAFGLGPLLVLSACGGGQAATPATQAEVTSPTTQQPSPTSAPSPTLQQTVPTQTLAAATSTANPPTAALTATTAPTSSQAATQPTGTPTTQPQGSSSAQSWQQIGAGTSAQLRSVSCPSAKLCLAAGAQTALLKSTDGGQTWTAKQVNVPESVITQVFCESESKCLALFNDPISMTGGVLETGDGGETWTQTESWDASRPPIARISCVASGDCYGIADTGIVKRTGADSHWHGTIASVFPAPPPATDLADIACPSEQLCLALGQPKVNEEGIIVRVTNGGADSSRVANLSQDLQTLNFNAVTCTDEATCFAAGSDGFIVKSKDGGATWTRLSWTPPSSQGPFEWKGISCASASACVLVGGNVLTGQCCGAIIRTADGGDTWTNEKLDLPNLLWSVSCTSETDCVAVGDNGLIVRLAAGGLASLPSATSAPQAGDIIANAVMAAGVKGFNMPAGITDTFPPDAKVIHTVLTTSQAPAGTRFKIVWTAVDVGSAGNPNTKIGEFSDTLEGSDNRDYYFTPSGTLPAGTYKVDLYVNDKLDRTLNFSVRAGASAPVVDTTPSAVGSCLPAPPHKSQSAIIQSVTMAKDTDSSSKAPINPTSTFSSNAVFHAAVDVVNAPDNTRFKALWFATDVGDAAPCNFQITEPTVLTTSGSTNLDFTLNRSQGFPVGSYRVEIYVNDQFAMKADFSVQ